MPSIKATVVTLKATGEVYGYAISLIDGQYLFHKIEAGEPTDGEGILRRLAEVGAPPVIAFILGSRDADQIQEDHAQELVFGELGPVPYEDESEVANDEQF